MNVAIIPARSGSKRIKNKNIKSFMGKPIIAWSIEAAKKAKIFDDIVVSTNSKKIANISKKFGAKIPFQRSSRLSNDKVGLLEVINNVVSYYRSKNINLNYVCMIYAASPLILPKDLVRGYTKLKKNKKLDYVMSASKLNGSYYRSFKFFKNKIYPLNKKNIRKRSQDFSKLYYENAQFIIGRSKSWLMGKHPYLSKSSIVEIDSFRSQDIDDRSDWVRAEKIFKIMKKK